MQSLLLSTLISRMDRIQSISVIEEQYKVKDLDDAIRELRRQLQPAWTLKKSTLKVFSDVLIYPVATDHSQLGYLDTILQGESKRIFQDDNANFAFTTLQQFYENPNYRNDLTEIWDRGTKFLGIRYDNGADPRAGSQQVSTTESLTGWTSSGDAGTLSLETVLTKDNNYSIKVPVVSSSGTATISNAFTAFLDADYLKKYFFVWVYLASAPTSITLKYGVDSSNCFYGTITSQFSGQSLVANDWNLLAFDLSNPTGTTGTPTTLFSYQAIVLTGASTGTYYIDASYVRSWTLLDYWYYSTFNVKTNSASVADQQFFYNSTTDLYSLDTALVGDAEWVDVVMYSAMLSSLSDEKDHDRIQLILSKKEQAWADLKSKYPDSVPLPTFSRFQFRTDYLENI